jgi:hypothetical protein
MSVWAGLLKKLGLHIDISKLKNVVRINFTTTINVDKSVHVEGDTLHINPSRLVGKQKRGLKKALREEMFLEAGAVINQDYEPTIVEALKSLPSKQDIAKKLTPIIPPGDVPLFRACLFLRRQFEAGANIADLKNQITRRYGTRGSNFANLCSSGYLETWFWPLYEELLRANPGDPAAATAQFQIHYKRIVNDLPWTEFVSAAASAATATAHIVDKMSRNITNGVRYLNIHGLGAANMRKIESILPEIERKTRALVAKMEKDQTRIFVRLEIPAGVLPP